MGSLVDWQNGALSGANYNLTVGLIEVATSTAKLRKKISHLERSDHSKRVTLPALKPTSAYELLHLRPILFHDGGNTPRENARLSGNNGVLLIPLFPYLDRYCPSLRPQCLRSLRISDCPSVFAKHPK